MVDSGAVNRLSAFKFSHARIAAGSGSMREVYDGSKKKGTETLRVRELQGR